MSKKLTGDCEIDCQEICAYPGQFSECECDTAPVAAALSALRLCGRDFTAAIVLYALDEIRLTKGAK